VLIKHLIKQIEAKLELDDTKAETNYKDLKILAAKIKLLNQTWKIFD
jgi:hypothetical protein